MQSTGMNTSRQPVVSFMRKVEDVRDGPSLEDLLMLRNAPFLSELNQKREEASSIVHQSYCVGYSLTHYELQGWNQEQLDRKFATQRAVADNASSKAVKMFTQQMTQVLYDIDDKVAIVDVNNPSFRFLDIG